MPKKKQTFVALFHTQWTSAKATVPPAALKRCEFKSGLGPMLDTLEKKWDAAADQDPVPQKVLADLAAQVAKFQQVAVSYRAKVIKANADDPANGPGWFALHEALHKIDVVGLAGAMPPEGKAVADAVRAMVTKMENTPVPT